MNGPFKRDEHWRMVKPGLYVDPQGFGHVFPDEICATLGWPYTQENYDIIVEAVRRMGGQVVIAAHERLSA